MTEEADPTAALTRTNLLRLETTELLSESTLHVHPPLSLSSPHHIGEERAHWEVKWSPVLRRYLHRVNDVLTSATAAAGNNNTRVVLSPDICAVEGGYRVPLCSDKFQKHVNGGGHKETTKWEFDGPTSLTLVPVGSLAHLGNAGLTNRHANGNNVPVLDVAVLVEGMVGGKDYLNGRYGDKRNILAIHIAKLLSQKKHRSIIGAVHITPVFGDSRKVGLLLTPPNDDQDEPKKNDKKRKSQVKKQVKKTRFRIRLIFGMKHGVVKNTGNDEDDSVGDDEEEPWECWIPRSRLFPDRSNNRSEKQNDSSTSVIEGSGSSGSSTPHYTNEIAEDLHYVSTTKLINSTIVSLVGGNTVGNASVVTSSFHETLILIKVWALQRGFLRGHDAFTTTSLAVLLVYLYRTKGIGRRMGSMQAFTAFMKFWSETDWLGEDTLEDFAYVPSSSGARTKAEVVLQRKVLKKKAFVIPEDGSTESQTIDRCEQSRLYLKDVRGSSRGRETLLDSYKLHYTSASSSFTVCGSHHDSPVLLDPTMTINYLARLSPSFVRESRAEAHAALVAIHGHEGEEAGGGAFRKLFLQTNRFWTRYDAYLRIPMSCVPKFVNAGSKKKRSKGKGDAISNDNRVWGKDVDDLGYNESVCRGVVDVLSLALKDRITAIRALALGNGDIRTSSSESVEDTATECMVDSDEYLAAPIRGTATNHAFGADLSTRSPEPPVLAANQRDQYMVIALRMDPNTSRRIVDRGPPAEDVEGSDAFVSLWGEKMAQIRRFQDGAIVRAVVWNTPSNNSSRPESVRYSNDDKLIGGIAEKIVQHIVEMHFACGANNSKPVSFELRNLVSLIDGVTSEKPSLFSDSMAMHKNVILAFDSLSDFLRRNSATTIDIGKGKQTSKLGLPLSIDEVEPLSPCLRYSSLFPPTPHPFLGGASSVSGGKVPGVVTGEPILIQIRFQTNNKWPSNLNAMGAAKCAMLLQLAEGIQKMKTERSSSDDMAAFDGPIDNTPGYLIIGYRGYAWRIVVRADQELRMLKGLKNPTKEAKQLQESLINRHIRGSMHHSLIHAVHTRHSSASAVVRLATRWIASHLLSDVIPHEAIELMVAKLYTDTVNDNIKLRSVASPPSTVMAGFLRFLQLLFSHNWSREPLIVDPQSHISQRDRSLILSQFDVVRGPDHNKGPAMYIISPADYDGVEGMIGSKLSGIEEEAPQALDAEKDSVKVWAPSVTATHPERVVLARASALAKCSHDHLLSCITRGGGCSNKWTAVFQESSASLTSYSALLRVDQSFVTDNGCSSTDGNFDFRSAAETSASIPQACSPFEKSLQKRFDGPKELRKKHFKNLVLDKDTLLDWNPVKSLVSSLRKKYHHYAVFFYNEYCPDIIAMLWRPTAFVHESFSAMVSEFKHPVVNHWKEDTLVVTNTDDVLYELGYLSKDIVTDMKVLDDKKQVAREPARKKSKTRDDIDE